MLHAKQHKQAKQPLINQLYAIKWAKFFFVITDQLETIIEEHEKTYDENNIRDFIDAFLQEKKKGTDSTFTVGPTKLELSA